MKNRLLFLGTGASLGVPLIGCRCPVCTSEDPRNQRLRPSALLTIDGLKILIDAGPDFRTQALRHQIQHIDGVIITHAHNDHVAGLDDLRAYHIVSKQPIPCLLSPTTHEDLKNRYAYIFARKESLRLVSQFAITLLPAERGKIDFLGLGVDYITYEQAGMLVNGFRFGELAYISDIKKYPDSIFDDLKGVKTLVVSALRHAPSPLHFSVEDAILFSQKVGAERVLLMHIDHNIDHEKANATLPSNIQLAYDGQEVEF